MMSDQFAIRTSTVLVLLFILVLGNIIDAQSQSGGLLLRETTSGLEIALVNDSGVVTSVLQSLPDYSFTPSGNSLWVLHPDFLIPTQQEIAVSPDGTQLAFVAIQNQTQFQLVVFQQATGTLIEETLPGYAYPIWSPDGQELLLEMIYVPDGTTLPESSIYSLSANTFRQLTNDVASRESDFQWLPNGNNIIYQKNRNIFLTDSSLGTTDQQLTQIEQQILPEITPAICDLVWSPVIQRIYFSVGCGDDIEYLYSVDLNANVRFELSVIALYPESYDPSFVPVNIAGIFPSESTTDVFVLIEIRTLNTSNGSQDKRVAIYHLTAPESAQLVFERVYTFDNSIGITTSDISPDQSYIAFAGGDSGEANSYELIVINLSNGSITFEQSALQGVCDIDWLNENTLAYEIIPRLNCFADRFATSMQSVDVTTGSVTTVSSSPSVIGTPFQYLGNSGGPTAGPTKSCSPQSPTPSRRRPISSSSIQMAQDKHN